ncbi:transglycosylase SLT domain-containing protein [Alcaligenes faecalis]|uniref:transglycosylase SLT domain-containing protein n=1 Tax=Alcaligenes faecalis TaxID=511 RepID=UPI0006C63D25|nr:transglycosylase SLT domain-containing protein [Alcaligenes faecalis]ATH99556.1 lytic transglycosylase [Alcaligenes faecalis]AYZ92343.1 lytic transglycosylase [Alcaligenes faecalis]MCX5593081.1 transglycosylase SLT domain-containing protein [Alcaligenes faecalis]QQC31858.1 transglycosylase SLT domain-containing protein [Alcaligenes faecalis]CAJ0903407.1 Lytic transglycosylase [Alcaligenes faecalis subsp. faecalis]
MQKLIDVILGLLALFFRPEKVEAVPASVETKPLRRLAWGRKVSQAFRDRLFEICQILGVEPDYLMACMAFESAETFSPSIKNAAGSGATGLIQFMPNTAKGLGTTTAALAMLTAEQQLEWVLAYFMPYKGRLKTLADVYMAILWPAAIGKADGWTLWDKASRPTTYRQNAGLDLNKDGKITKAEAAAKVLAKLERGRQAQFQWEGT